MSPISESTQQFSCAQLQRYGGVLELRLHTDGGPFVFNFQALSELPDLFTAIARDTDVRVVVLTGTGDSFCGSLDTESYRGSASGERLYWLVTHLLPNLLDIEAVVISAVNGPVRYHAEIAVVSDIVLCSDTTVFQDRPHMLDGKVPGDGSNIVWPELLGSNRGRYFLLTGEELNAQEALRLGVVNEVLPPADLLPRAHELAQELASKPPLALRYTRICLVQRWRRLLQHELSHGMLLELAARSDRRQIPST